MPNAIVRYIFFIDFYTLLKRCIKSYIDDSDWYKFKLRTKIASYCASSDHSLKRYKNVFSNWCNFLGLLRQQNVKKLLEFRSILES